MFIARILYPVKVFGPGNRIGIWFDGCKHGCKGCSNPELWAFQDKYAVSLENILNLVKSISEKYDVDGFTITGGDPFEQPLDLKLLLKELKNISDDVIVYTGYEYEFLKKEHVDILKEITVLIDGPYVEEKNDNCFMRGSSNQRIIILDSKYFDFYDEYLKNGINKIQNFTSQDGIISVGIHRVGYDKELDNKMQQMGLEEC